MRREHSQHRIIGALRLGPMSRPQLAKCLSLDYSTVTNSLNDLEARRKVRLRRSAVRAAHYGPPVVVFELLQGGQR
jgi:DNA-binding MarR family transcriptional regulator